MKTILAAFAIILVSTISGAYYAITQEDKRILIADGAISRIIQANIGVQNEQYELGKMYYDLVRMNAALIGSSYEINTDKSYHRALKWLSKASGKGVEKADSCILELHNTSSRPGYTPSKNCELKSLDKNHLESLFE